MSFSFSKWLIVVVMSISSAQSIAFTYFDPKPAKDSIYKLPKPPEYTLSVAMIFQDEASYLREWIEFHRLVGVDHFYLYNNLSTDNYLEVLQPYIESGVVELTEWPRKANNVQEWDGIQIQAFRNAFKKAKKTSKWLALIDSDEFIVPVEADDLPTILAKYENVPGIGGIFAYWVVFGTSFVEKVPDDKLMIEMLTLNGGPGKGHFKTIVQTAKTSDVVSPHFAVYKEGYHHQEVLHNVIQINHYWSRDEWFFNNIKIPRREAWGTPAEACRYWNSAQNNWTVEGEVILRFVDQLRDLMEFD